MITKRIRSMSLVLAAVVVVAGSRAAECRKALPVPLKFARIYWEYNASANDLGVHVTLDAEDWRELRIVNPNDRTIFTVEGRGPYKDLGMTELFFEGAEPSLADFPLADLLALFPEGEYDFVGTMVDGSRLESVSTFSHAIPAAPSVSVVVGPANSLVFKWTPVTAPPAGFPSRPIDVVGYEVIVDDFDVIMPATATMVTVSPEFVASLAPGEQSYEVLAIEANGNQTITAGTFVKP